MATRLKELDGELEKPRFKDLEAQLEKLQKELETKYHDKPQAEWPSELMAQYHGVAQQITEIVVKPLYDTMDFPSAAKCDPGRFFTDHADCPPNFTRKKDWLEKKGYKMHRTTYMYSKRWDKVPIKAAFFIPQNLKSKDKVPIMWYFHGGGYVSCLSKFEPYF